MRKIIGTGIIIMTLIMSIVGTHAIAEKGHDESEISTFIELSEGKPLSQETIRDIHNNFKSTEVNCGDIKVTLDEAMFDGQTLYTAASVVATAPDVVLIMPGSAHLNEPVAGGYGENKRDDLRSFVDAAREDEQKIICVYVYPKEFDELGFYALDHLQMEEGRSVLYSCATFDEVQTEVSFNWTIQLYDVDLLTGNYTAKDQYAVSSTIQAIRKK